MTEHLSQIAGVLRQYTYNFADERTLQDGLEQVISAHWEYRREYELSTTDRPDFWLPEFGIAVEVKIGGPTSSVLRQLYRYAGHEQVQGILLVSSCMRHQVPDSMNAKPVLKLQLHRL